MHVSHPLHCNFGNGLLVEDVCNIGKRRVNIQAKAVVFEDDCLGFGVSG